MTRLVFGDDVGPLPVENETPSGTRKLAPEILDDVRRPGYPRTGDLSAACRHRHGPAPARASAAVGRVDLAAVSWARSTIREKHYVGRGGIQASPTSRSRYR